MCVGWNAEPNKAFVAKQLSRSTTLQEVLSLATCFSAVRFDQWRGCHVDTRIRLLVQQAYLREHEEVAANICKHAGSFKRCLWLDPQCEEFIMAHCGSATRQQYKEYTSSAHRADLFRYLLLFVRGGVYLDMKSCLLSPLGALLGSCCQGADSISCVGAAGSHFHQGAIREI